MHDIINTIVNFASELWYTGLFIMMVVEWTIFPIIPSELIMIPAWYLSSIWKMDFTIALLVWSFWAIVWAVLNYILWYYLWNKIIHKLIKKYWKYLFITMEHYNKTEAFSQKHWNITIFIARFIPLIRHLISIPAWVFKMDFTKFFIYTTIGLTLWNIILMSIWYFVWENKELINKYLHEIWIYLIIIIIIIIHIYVFKNKKKYAKI